MMRCDKCMFYSHPRNDLIMYLRILKLNRLKSRNLSNVFISIRYYSWPCRDFRTHAFDNQIFLRVTCWNDRRIKSDAGDTTYLSHQLYARFTNALHPTSHTMLHM